MIDNVLSLAFMSVTGLIVGWRIRGSFLDAVLAYLLLLVFADAPSWIMAYVALHVPSAFANWNPVSAVTQACRELFGNLPPGTPEPTAWPLANPVIYTLIWAVAIVAVFAPLSVRSYAKTAK